VDDDQPEGDDDSGGPSQGTGRSAHATGYRRALASPLVRRLWVATAASVVGDFIGQGALLFLAVDRTGQALGAAGVLAVGVIPTLLTGMLGGAWLDRLPRVPALVGLQLLGAAVICLPVVADGIGVVYLTAALLAVIRTGTIAVRAGAMAEALDDDRRGPLIALLSSTDQAGQVLGYLAGGALYLALGTSVALLVDSATFVVGALVLATLRFPRPTRSTQRPGPSTGLRLIARDPVLRLLAILVVATGMVASLPEVLAPVVAAPDDPWRPFVLAAAPLGQAVTMTVVGRLPRVRRPSTQLNHLAWLVLALGITALGRSPAWIAFGNLLVGSGVAWLVGPQLTFLRLAPPANMAQISATMVALLAVADGAGSLAYARLADVHGVPAAYRAAGVLLLVITLAGWLAKERTPAALALDRDELPDPR
jgi:MFS family permease